MFNKYMCRMQWNPLVRDVHSSMKMALEAHLAPLMDQMTFKSFKAVWLKTLG